MVGLAWQLAWLARFNFYFDQIDWRHNLVSMLIVVVTQGMALWPVGLYRGLWRFASIPDLWNILRAVAAGSLCSLLLLFIFTRLEGVPRTTFILYPVFLILFLGGPRLLYRLWKDHGLNFRALSGGRRVLVVGAGQAGETLVRDMLRDGEYLPIGFVDDQPRLWNTQIRGISILGAVERLPEIARLNSAELIMIAIPSATNAQMQRIVALCEQAERPFRTLPRLRDMVDGQAGVKALREVSIDDLLGRLKVQLDWRAIQEGIAGRTILVSGGGGSIGAEICRQIARLGPDALIILERNEFNLYRIEMELRQAFPRLKCHALLGDVADAAAVNHAFATHHPEIVFHAAAYKHVPILQFQVREAARNNILGTWVIANAAIRQGCRKFILISTDKAVNPTSVMGATKRITEIGCEVLNTQGPTRFVTVRFGNVLGSAGSVVPLFQEQIHSGGPVTVTHPEMTRYFMTIPEATQLILQAGAMGRGGEIFVLDMGEPVRIAYLAEQMIRLSGHVPGRDIRIEYTGLRPGERLREELFHQGEQLKPTPHGKILLAQHRPVERQYLEQALKEMIAACETFDEARIFALIRQLIPEMSGREQPQSNVVALQPKGAT
ncbi:MAG TPA: nucleoside-diphosphate sugar epimerase/dehydratase [Gammaproteobacteria bacterium]|nr:nucleoside-diphosphate sugar epimerase/dehydratase [Gammaproteobacteria bacterium]